MLLTEQSAPPHPAAAGVDACKSGWVAAVDVPGGGTRIAFFNRMAELIVEHERPGSRFGGPILIDVPIGLPQRGSRSCDLEARRLIGARYSSVFPAPIRELLGAQTYREACARGRAWEGRAISRQTFAILPRMAEVDQQMTVERQRVVREGHPEVSFRLLAGGPLRYGKSTVAGRDERWHLIAAVFPDLEMNAAPHRGRTLLIDVLDAYALLWSARRLAANIATTIPDRVEMDVRGLRCEMIA